MRERKRRATMGACGFNSAYSDDRRRLWRPVQKTRLCQRELLKRAVIDRTQNTFAGLREQYDGLAHYTMREKRDGALMCFSTV